MEIRQSFTVDRPIETVWAALCDFRLIASCVPGAELTSISPSGDEVEGRIRTRVGPMTASFSGKAVVSRDDAAHTGRMEGSGSDKNSASRVKINLDYVARASADGKSTTTETVAQVVLTGPLAQFGKTALMNDIATAMTAEFTKNLQAAIAGLAATNTSKAQPPAAPAELRPMKLLWMVVKARLKALFGISPKSPSA